MAQSAGIDNCVCFQHCTTKARCREWLNRTDLLVPSSFFALVSALFHWPSWASYDPIYLPSTQAVQTRRLQECGVTRRRRARSVIVSQSLLADHFPRADVKRVDLLQRGAETQSEFGSVHGGVLELDGIPLEVDGLETGGMAETVTDSVVVGNMVVGTPEVGELGEAVEVLDLADGVAGDVEHLEVDECVETLELADLVVGEIELLEAGEAVETLDLLDAVALDAEDAEVLEHRETLEPVDLVLAKPQLAEVDEGVEALDGLDTVAAQLQVLQLDELVEVFDLRDLVLHKVQVLQLGEALEVLDVLDVVEAEVQVLEVREVADVAGDVLDAVVVEIQLLELELRLRIKVFQRVEADNEVVPQVDALEVLEPLQTQALQGGDLQVDQVDVGGVERDVCRQLVVGRQHVDIRVGNRREPVRLLYVRQLVVLLLLLLADLLVSVVELLVDVVHVFVLRLRVRARKVQPLHVPAHCLCERVLLVCVGHGVNGGSSIGIQPASCCCYCSGSVPPLSCTTQIWPGLDVR